MTPAEWRKWVHKSIGHHAEDFEPADLQFIADGPLCDPARPYCPAGKLSWRDTYQREAQQVRAA